MAAGSIVISLLLASGSFSTDTDRAAKKLKQFQKQAEDVGKAIGVSIAAGAALAVAAFDQLVKGAANFQDLEETTGASAEGLASLAVGAATAGVSIDEVAGATIRLTKSLTGVDDESKAAGAALAALGIPLEEFKALDPVGQIDALTAAFGKFADGSGKTAVAVALFGKTGAEQLKLFKALEEQGGRTTILTQQQIGLADAYADAQAKTTAELKLYAQAAAAIASGPLLDLSKAFKALLVEMIAVDRTTGQLAANNAIRGFAESAAIAVANVTDFLIHLRKVALTVADAFGAVGADIRAAFKVAGAVVSFGPAQGIEETTKRIKSALDDREAQVRGANERLSNLLNANPRALRDNLTKSFAERARLEQPDDARENARFAERAADLLAKPSIKFKGPVPVKKGSTGPREPTDDPTKQLLDNRLKELQSAMDRERDLLASRNKFLDIFNSQGLLSIQAYYDAQRTIIEAATSAQAVQIDKQIAEIRKVQETPKRKEKDKADDQGEINKLVAQRVKLLSEAGEKGIELAIKQAEEERRLGEQIESVNAEVLELQGNLGAAAAIRFDQQNFDRVNRFMAEGNQGALQLVATLRKATIAQGQFSAAVAGASKVQDSLRAAEDRIAISRQLGATTELGALQQLGAARQAAVAQMEAIVQAQEAVARASQNPALVRQADEARLALEKLRAEAEPLRDKFQSIFEGGFGDAFADFLDGTKSAKEAFKSFADDIVRQINRIAAQEIAQSLFGKAGPAGGLGDFVGKLFGATPVAGGGAKAATGAGVAAVANTAQEAFRATELAAQAASSTAVATANTALATSATAATTGLATLPPVAAATTAGITPVAPAALALTAAVTASTAAETAASAIVTTAATTGAAALAALTAAASAAAAALSAVAASSAASAGASAVGAFFDSGGYTGNVGVKQPAGVVHGQEFVFSAPAVRAIGVTRLDEMHRKARGGTPRLNLSGFADGGAVGRFSMPVSASSAGATAAMASSAVTAAAGLAALTPVVDNTSAGLADVTQKAAPSAEALGGLAEAAKGAASALRGLSGSGGGLFGLVGGGGGLAGLLGFDSGGYTGNVGVMQPAGVVHGREFVFSAPAVQSIGVGNLEELHEKARGGVVAGMSPLLEVAGAAAERGSGSKSVGGQPLRPPGFEEGGSVPTAPNLAPVASSAIHVALATAPASISSTSLGPVAPPAEIRSLAMSPAMARLDAGRAHAYGLRTDAENTTGLAPSVVVRPDYSSDRQMPAWLLPVAVSLPVQGFTRSIDLPAPAMLPASVRGLVPAVRDAVLVRQTHASEPATNKALGLGNRTPMHALAAAAAVPIAATQASDILPKLDAIDVAVIRRVARRDLTSPLIVADGVVPPAAHPVPRSRGDIPALNGVVQAAPGAVASGVTAAPAARQSEANAAPAVVHARPIAALSASAGRVDAALAPIQSRLTATPAPAAIVPSRAATVEAARAVPSPLHQALALAPFAASALGYTGSAAADQPVGVVHGQEFVFSAPAVRALSVPVLERIHDRARVGLEVLEPLLPGFAGGGFVGSSSSGGEMAAWEDDPERFVPRTSGAVLPVMSPTSKNSGGRAVSVTNHFTITGPVDARTQQQIAAATARSVAAANMRGN